MVFAQMRCVLISKLPFSLLCAPTLPEAPPTPAVVHGKPAALRTQASAPDVFSCCHVCLDVSILCSMLLPEDNFPSPRLFLLNQICIYFKCVFFSPAWMHFFFCLSVWFVLKFAKLECMKPLMQTRAFANVTPKPPKRPHQNPQIICKADDFPLGIIWDLFNCTISSLLLYFPFPPACLPLDHFGFLNAKVQWSCT